MAKFEEFKAVDGTYSINLDNVCFVAYDDKNWKITVYSINGTIILKTTSATVYSSWKMIFHR